MQFKFGIEHEVAFLNRNGQFADFSNTQFAEFDTIVAALPEYASDYPQLRIGDAGIKRKRWYIEGFERFDEQGRVTDCLPKGIEIRTTIHSGIQGAIAELQTSFQQLRAKAVALGFTPVLTSFNPQLSTFEPNPPLNDYEFRRRQASAEKQTAHIPMLTYGPDLNFSIPGLQPAEIIDIGQKLTFYSPYILPFSYSSPFYKGRLWLGPSIRTFIRTGARPAAMVFVNPEHLLQSTPSLTKPTRLPAETGRIEFKAFDSCADFRLYGALLALLKGLALDKTLPGRALVPDAALHQQSACGGFQDETIFEGAQAVMAAVEGALGRDLDADLLAPLDHLLNHRQSPADEMIQKFRETGHLLTAMQYAVNSYEIDVA